jgi:hypothetical protein
MSCAYAFCFIHWQMFSSSIESESWKIKLEEKLFHHLWLLLAVFSQIPDLISCVYFNFVTGFVARCLCRGFRQCPKVIFIHFLCPFHKFIIPFFSPRIVCQLLSSECFVCVFMKRINKNEAAKAHIHLSIPQTQHKYNKINIMKVQCILKRIIWQICSLSPKIYQRVE